jgi:hypothetical protein
VAASIQRLVAGAAPSGPRPSAGPNDAHSIAPRMAAKMPTNIFADTSSVRMQSLYMPVLGRMVGRPTPMLARPRAHRSEQSRMMTQSLSTPEGLYSVLLGEVGERLRDEKPAIAARLEASLKRAAAAFPTAGDQAAQLLGDQAQYFRTTVESWLGAGQESIERNRSEPVLSASQGAARTMGDYIGGIFAIDQHGAGSSDIDLVRQEADRVEQQLRSERTFVDQGLLDRVSQMLHHGAGRQIEAFQGPTSRAIAEEMGAEAFSIENMMFLPEEASQGLMAHEMVHAIKDSSDSSETAIEREEETAYGVQGAIESGRQTVQQELQAATDRMELAKEENIPPAKLYTDPGGAAGTSEPDPGRRTSNPKEQAQKEAQILESIISAVAGLIEFESDLDLDRYGRH